MNTFKTKNNQIWIENVIKIPNHYIQTNKLAAYKTFICLLKIEANIIKQGSFLANIQIHVLFTGFLFNI